MAGVGNGGGGGGGGNIRAGRAFVELYAEDNAVFRSLDRLKRRFQSFAGLTIKAGLALGAGGAAALAPLKLAVDTLDEQGKLLGAANALGIDPQKASELFGIMKAGGSDLRDAVEGMATFGGRVEEALSGRGEVAKELFDKLGVSAAEFKALGPEKAFYAVLEAIKASVPETERLNTLMKAFGEDTGKNLMQVLSFSADEMRGLGEASSMSAEQLKAAQTASVQWKIATATLGSAWGQVAQALAPVLTSFAQWLKEVVQPFAAWVRENRELVVIGVKVAAGMAAAGVALVALGVSAGLAATAVGAAVAVVKLLAAAVLAVLSPVGLVVAAIGGIGALLITQTETGREALDGLRATVQKLGDVFGETWAGIKAAVQAGDLALAFKVAGAGIKAAWYELMADLTRAMAKFGRDLVNGPLGKLHFSLGDPSGLKPADLLGAIGGEEVKSLAAAADARAELKRLVEEAKAKAAAVAVPPAALAAVAPGAARASVSVGSQGSFTAAMAAQRFSLFDDVPLKQLKEAQKANVALNAIDAGVAALAGALAFK